MFKFLKWLFLCRSHEWKYGAMLFCNFSGNRHCEKCGKKQKKINGNTGNDFRDDSNWADVEEES